jgi:hypothetical protein
MGEKDLRATDVTKAELTKHPHLSPQGIKLSVARNSTEYRALLKDLESPAKGMTVGKTKGVADRNIFADAFFAETQAGTIPKYATADGNIYKPLARRAGIQPEKLGNKKIPEVYPTFRCSERPAEN